MSPVPGVDIEPLRWWHIDQCAALDSAVFQTTAWSAESFWGELARVPDSRYYVVALELPNATASEPVVVGYAGLSALPPEADVQTIAVAPHAQGMGLGGALLDDLLREAERRECPTVLLEVAADNDGAIALYRSRRFESISRRPGYYGQGRDAVIMRRRTRGEGADHG